MLVPEIWCRMRVHERDPNFLIENGLLERVEDFELAGRTVLASRLGYRITALFVDRFLGRIFETPDAVFTEEILRPEKQSLELFAAGVDAIVEAQRSVALNYFEDGSVAAACPPLKALLHIMAHGEYEGMSLSNPGVSRAVRRETRARKRLVRGATAREAAARHRTVEPSRRRPGTISPPGRIGRPRTNSMWKSASQSARTELARVSSPAYLAELRGTIGADPFHGQTPS